LTIYSTKDYSDIGWPATRLVDLLTLYGKLLRDVPPALSDEPAGHAL